MDNPLSLTYNFWQFDGWNKYVISLRLLKSPVSHLSLRLLFFLFHSHFVPLRVVCPTRAAVITPNSLKQTWAIIRPVETNIATLATQHRINRLVSFILSMHTIPYRRTPSQLSLWEAGGPRAAVAASPLWSKLLLLTHFHLVTFSGPTPANRPPCFWNSGTVQHSVGFSP